MTRKNTGFTLVEILIVVIILGILAAIVIPQFTEASNDARVSAVVSDLQTVRSQIELYKVQHLDQFPGSVDSGAIPNGAALVTALTSKTLNTGAVDATNGTLGPYLGKFPTNPFSAAGGNTVALVTGTDPNTTSATNGWFFNTDTGNFGIYTEGYGDR